MPTSQRRKPLEVFRVGVFRRDGPVVVFGDQALPGGGVEILKIGLRQRPRAVVVDPFVDKRHGRLGQHADRGDDDLELLRPEFINGEECLVFPGQKHVAHVSLGEGVRRAPRARIEHGNLLEQPGDELPRLRLGGRHLGRVLRVADLAEVAQLLPRAYAQAAR